MTWIDPAVSVDRHDAAAILTCSAVGAVAVAYASVYFVHQRCLRKRPFFDENRWLTLTPVHCEVLGV